MRHGSFRFLRILSWVGLCAVGACGHGGGGGPPAPPTYALSFDGVDDLADFAFPSFGSGGAWTVEAWLNPTALLPNAGSYAGLVRDPGVWVLTLDSDQTSFSYVVCVPGCNAAPSATGTLQTGAWQHVAGVFDGSEIRIYLNGGLVGSVAQPGSSGGVAQVIVGYWGSGFAGLMDEVRVWDVVRSQAQIQATMGSILTGSEAGLQAYWRFEETSGQTLNDATPNGRNGTLGASGLVAADDPARVLGGAPVS